MSITFLQPRFFPASGLVIPDKGYLKLIGRFCVGLSLTLPLYLFSMYLSYLKPEDVYLATFGETIFPYLTASIIVFTLSNEIYLKLGLAAEHKSKESKADIEELIGLL